MKLCALERQAMLLRFQRLHLLVAREKRRVRRIADAAAEKAAASVAGLTFAPQRYQSTARPPSSPGPSMPALAHGPEGEGPVASAFSPSQGSVPCALRPGPGEPLAVPRNPGALQTPSTTEPVPTSCEDMGGPTCPSPSPSPAANSSGAPDAAHLIAASSIAP